MTTRLITPATIAPSQGSFASQGLEINPNRKTDPPPKKARDIGNLVILSMGQVSEGYFWDCGKTT